MARVDVRTLQSLNLLERKQSFFTYHYLARVHGFTNKSDLKHLKNHIADYFPEMAAQIFYHFDDREMAGILVEDYSTHADDKLRTLALGVRDLLRARSSVDNQLEGVLRTTLTVGRESGEDEVAEGFIDNYEKAVEDRAYSQQSFAFI